MGNTNLHKAKEAKNDEFYTQLNDVSNELYHYRQHFRDKVIFCNCDDPTWSAFWRYFHLNFNEFHLKKLISTHYDKTESTYKMEYFGEDDNDVNVGVKTPLLGNGDFRNEECLKLLDEADIVVTNPPFSLYREYVDILMKHGKKFIIWSNTNSVTYKEIFPLIKDNKIWAGYMFNKTCTFRLSDNYTKYDEKITAEKNDGHKYGKVPSIAVFTNLNIKKRHEDIILWKPYKPQDFPKYDNYDAINVDKVCDIPCDYCESWEVSKAEYECLPKSDWEFVRKGFREDIETVFIIPAKGTELRELLSNHTEGYKEKIEESLRNLLTTAGFTENALDRQTDRQTDSLLLLNYCSGIIGVPITFLDKHNPEQFRIIGNEYSLAIDKGRGYVQGKRMYSRLFINRLL